MFNGARKHTHTCIQIQITRIYTHKHIIFEWQPNEWASKRCKRAKEWNKNRIQKQQYKAAYACGCTEFSNGSYTRFITLCVRAFVCVCVCMAIVKYDIIILNVWPSTLCAALCAFIDANTHTHTLSWTKRKFIQSIQLSKVWALFGFGFGLFVCVIFFLASQLWVPRLRFFDSGLDLIRLVFRICTQKYRCTFRVHACPMLRCTYSERDRERAIQ